MHRFGIAPVFCFAAAMALGTALHAASWQTIYEEDFTTDPGFASPHYPSEIYWDAAAGHYHVHTEDHSGAHRYHFGHSPVFGTVDTASSFRVQFDVYTEQPKWGNYPGIFFFDSATMDYVANPFEGYIFGHKVQDWSDSTHKKMKLQTPDQGTIAQSPTVSENTWYTVSLDYDAQTQTIDWIVTQRSNGNVFVNQTSLPFLVTGSFDQFIVGERSGGTRYGRTSIYHLDNVLIESFTDGASAIPAPLAMFAIPMMLLLRSRR